MKITKKIIEERRAAANDTSNDKPVVGAMRTTLLGFYVRGKKVSTTRDIQIYCNG